MMIRHISISRFMAHWFVLGQYLIRVSKALVKGPPMERMTDGMSG
jgi:hypothetical protein